MRTRGVEPPRPKAATRPSTWRVYQFRHVRLRDCKNNFSTETRAWKIKKAGTDRLLYLDFVCAKSNGPLLHPHREGHAKHDSYA